MDTKISIKNYLDRRTADKLGENLRLTNELKTVIGGEAPEVDRLEAKLAKTFGLLADVDAQIAALGPDDFEKEQPQLAAKRQDLQALLEKLSDEVGIATRQARAADFVNERPGRNAALKAQIEKVDRQAFEGLVAFFAAMKDRHELSERQRTLHNLGESTFHDLGGVGAGLSMTGGPPKTPFKKEYPMGLKGAVDAYLARFSSIIGSGGLPDNGDEAYEKFCSGR